jgi:hypothetical protein
VRLVRLAPERHANAIGRLRHDFDLAHGAGLGWRQGD